MVLLLALAGGGWTMVEDKAAALEWLSSNLTSAIALGKSLMGETDRAAISTEPPPLSLAPLRLLDTAMLRAAAAEAAPSSLVPGENGVAAPEQTASITVEKLNPESSPEETEPARSSVPEKPAPLPPLPPLTDPLQKKAESVGLHPELSRALLESLSATDFKNAAIAIKKAISETPEDGVLVWPQKAARGLARFRVHFVPGISPACRRYVVGVAKSGWLTTALPMERCGVKPKVARSTIPKGSSSGAVHR
ncbi:MAG: hypothetical protein AB7E81_14255 [Hyphomicrobiaceae bacterium]